MLTYNKDKELFVLSSSDKKRAEDAGLVLSTTAKASQPIYFSDNPYAVLQWYGEADSVAKEKLGLLYERYMLSRAVAPEHDNHVFWPNNCVPMPFQIAGVEYALENPFALIADPPGLGKTIQAIMLANAIKARKVLVICPGNLRLNWAREIRKWSTLERVSTYPILKGSNGVNPRSNYVITSYELAGGAVNNTLKATNWDLIILDEAHYCKSPEAKRTKAIFGEGGLIHKAKRALALTGTPLPNRPRECFTLLKGLCWDAIDWQSEGAFRNKYCPSVAFDSGFVQEDNHFLQELQARLRCNMMIRREKEEVLKDLPEKRYELSYVEPDGAIRKAISAERMLNLSVSDLENPTVAIFGQISTIRRTMGEAKVSRVIEHVKGLMEGGVDKLIVFAHHASVLDSLQEALAGYGVQRLCGKTPQSRRQEVVDRFQGDQAQRIFLGNIQAAGVGITLTAASHVVFAEASWVPGENEQCVDRAHRIGQKDSVFAQFLVAPGSLDERILAKGLEKLINIHHSLDRK